jgi:hypothetical protein
VPRIQNRRGRRDHGENGVGVPGERLTGRKQRLRNCDSIVSPLQGDCALIATNSQGDALGWIISAFQAGHRLKGGNMSAQGNALGKLSNSKTIALKGQNK